MNFNCTICNACQLFEHSKYSCDCFCKIWESTPWQIWIAWLHSQMSNYLKKLLKILHLVLLNYLDSVIEGLEVKVLFLFDIFSQRKIFQRFQLFASKLNIKNTVTIWVPNTWKQASMGHNGHSFFMRKITAAISKLAQISFTSK